MEIETAALIRYDLCHQSQSESLLTSLESLYDDEGEQFGERILGGQQWERYRFDGDIQISDEEFDAFDSMATLVSFETRHLIDIVTIAELGSEHITEFQEKEPSRTQYLIDELTDQLTGIAGEIPTVAPADINRQTVQVYIEPTASQPVFEDDGKISEELLAQFLDEKSETLSKYYYSVDHPQTLLNGDDLLSPHGTAFPWGKLTVFNLTAPPTSSSTFEPVWIRRLKPLYEYIRTYLWFNHRVALLAELDRDTHGIDSLMRTGSNASSQLDEALEIERELDDLRETWTNRYTKTVDEIADLQSRPPLRHRSRQELEPVNINKLTQGTPVNSLFDIYEQQLATQSDQIQSDLDRIGSKLDQVSSYIQDKINVRAMTATLRQQRATNILTIVILVLTAVTVAIAVVDLFGFPDKLISAILNAQF